MSYTHDEMRADTGLTSRQLDHWTRAGYLRPENPDCGTGHARRWPYAELKVARVMARLAKAGLTVEAAHRVARGQEELAPGVRVLVEAVPA